MPESKSSGDSPSRQPFTHEDMLERILTPRTTGTGRSGRRRKRRSHQPKKRRERRRKWMTGLLFGLSIPLVGAILVGIFWNHWRCESETFRKQLGEHLSETLGARVHVGPLDLQGRLLMARNVSLTGAAGGSLKYVEFRRLRARLAFPSFFGPRWKVESLAVEECDLHFAIPGDEQSAEIAPGKSAWRVPATAGIGLSSGPESWSIDSLQVRSLNVFWGSSGSGGGGYSLQGSRVYSGSVTEAGMFQLMGGQLEIEIPGFELDGARLKIAGKKLQLEEMLFVRETEGVDGRKSTIEASGVLDFAEGGEMNLDVVVRELGLELLIDKSWRDRLGGILNGDLKFGKAIRSPDPGIWEGGFSVDEAWLKGLAILDTLGELSGESRFRRIDFDEGFSGDLRKEEERVYLSNLKAEKSGLIKLRGSVALGEGGALSGDLMIGLPEALLLRLPGGRPDFFGEPEAGFSFANVAAGGSLAFPQESLSSRMQAASRAGRAATESVPSAPLSGASEKESRPATGVYLGTDRKARIEELFNALLE